MLRSSLLAPVLAAVVANAASLQQISNFGSNPTGVNVWIYKPDRVATPTPLVVGIHWCTGTADAFYQGTGYARYADQYGFIVLYPDAPDSSNCWDVHTNATLTHDAGGDSLGIVSAVRWTIQNHGVDPSLVFATGVSSGAMMTNVLMGAYPDIFKAGSAVSGVPYACFAGPNMWQSDCANGLLIKTPQEWGDLVRAGYPGYTGRRPRFQTWHGSTDNVLYPQNFQEQIKQWTNVLGVSQTPTSTSQNDPYTNYVKSNYGPNIQAIYANGVGHSLPDLSLEILTWWGLIGGSTSSTTTRTTSTTASTSTTRTTTATSTSTSPTSSATGQAPHWGQCGGIGWTGPTVCVPPYTCQKQNDWYSQCL